MKNVRDLAVFAVALVLVLGLCTSCEHQSPTEPLNEMSTVERSGPKPGQCGCTRTIGYWKTHAGNRGNNPDVVSQYLPIWLGDVGGPETIQVTNAAQAVLILSMKLGHPSNGITKLRAQLLGAKLNFAAGADDSAVASVVDDADEYLATHGLDVWAGLEEMERQMILGWMETLDDYNNGYIGPPHCP
jgi:hypothetical protein